MAVALLSGASTWSAAATPIRLPPTGSWGTAALLPAWYVRAAAATGPDGRIYVLGEYAPDQRTVIAYDAPTGKWRRVTSMHVGRLAAAAVQGPDGRIYVLGGLVAGKPHDKRSRSVEAYSVVTHRWTTLAPMLRPRAYVAVALGGDGRIYAVGGEQDIGQGVSVEAYNVRSNSWSTVPSPPLTGTSVSAVGGPDGRIYLMGGVDPSRSEVVAYDPKVGTWIQRAPMPRLGFEIGVTLGPDGWIYAVGGSGDDAAGKLQSQTSVEAYDAASDRWVELPPLPQPRAGAAVAALPDGRIFAVAGYDRAQSDSVASLNVDVFTPTGLTTPTPAPTPTTVLSTHARKCNKTYGMQLHARLAVCYSPSYLTEAQRQMARALDPRGPIASST
ncbi:MAG TPA: kelch repeat-containing protein, partial [Chloroflexota bacterium]